LLAAPAAWLAITVGRKVVTGVSTIELAFREGGGVDELIERLPLSIREKAHGLVERLPGGSDQVEDLAQKQAGKAAAAVPAAIVATSSVVLNVALMLVAFYLLLVDGKRLVHWIATAAPLPESQIFDILSDFRTVSVAVRSPPGTAGVQSPAAPVGYLPLECPSPCSSPWSRSSLRHPGDRRHERRPAAAGWLLPTGHPQGALAGLWAPW
jgi:hypothetical protein